MALTIISNKKDKSAVLHFNTSNTVVVAGNSSVSTIAIDNENITGAAIKQAFYGTDAGSIQVSRGGQLIAVFNNSGHVDFAASGMSLTINPTANIVVTFNATSNAYLLLEVSKIAPPSANSIYFQS